MLIMSNYYYILSSAKIYVKHFKRLKCYKTVKKCRNRENGFSPKEGNLRILSRIANRSTYRDLLQETKKKKKIAHFKDKNRERETLTHGTSANDPIHNYLLAAFEEKYRAILGTLSVANLDSLESELQDFYSIGRINLIAEHYKSFSRRLNSNFDLLFK
ncbi:hypothetical protein C922_04662 [Plasmodium inui San Antonio 1]|uniref:Uncharacterized protein n=1 Tax=Plasmodium inui San Antonio 1 TaxID=1237626 RepID=W7A046_9APIC|nr:hypothetical protein C922_04662 [Plasmodium inui San Antonio 1]EUD64930.1 hypothetical protein C922_04662 [Plasmodium inui San Antonio 1]